MSPKDSREEGDHARRIAEDKPEIEEAVILKAIEKLGRKDAYATCVMSYGEMRTGTFCGKCIPHLRGWDIRRLPKEFDQLQPKGLP